MNSSNFGVRKSETVKTSRYTANWIVSEILGCGGVPGSIHTQESNLSPEIDVAKERKVDSGAIEESAHDTGRAHVQRGLRVRKLRTRANSALVVRAIGLIIRVAERAVTVCLGPVMRVSGRDNHGNSIIDSEDDKG